MTMKKLVIVAVMMATIGHGLAAIKATIDNNESMVTARVTMINELTQ